MNWKKFSLIFLRNMVFTILVVALVMGLFGYLLAGKEGFINAAGWGLLLSLAFAPISLLIMINTKYWGDYAGRFSRWWVKKETEGEDQQK